MVKLAGIGISSIEDNLERIILLFVDVQVLRHVYVEKQGTFEKLNLMIQRSGIYSDDRLSFYV